MARLFSDDELEVLARFPPPPTRGGARDRKLRASAVRRRRARAFVRRDRRRTRNWITHTFGFAAQSGDPELLGGLIEATQTYFAVFPDPIAPVGDAEQSVAPLIAQLSEGTATDAALARFDAMEGRWRRAQDALRDWLSMLLSRIYRQRGIDTLEPRCVTPPNEPS